MRKIYEAALLFLGTLGWWGFVYPELCLDGEVYEEEACEEVVGEIGQEASCEAGWQIGEIRIKSRLVEYVCQIKENEIEEKRLDDEG